MNEQTDPRILPPIVARVPLELPEPPILPSRLTVDEKVYHQPTGCQPVIVSRTSYSEELTSEEKAWTRHIKISETWTVLDLGWVVEPSLVIVSNEEGTNFLRRPTAEQLALLKSKVVEISLRADNTGDIKVYPGRSARFCPILPVLLARCLCGTARVKVVALPL